MIKKITCIECPVGCCIDVEADGDNLVKISGAKCPKGEAYARREVFNPVREISSTVAASGLSVRMVPVKTDRHVPKDRIYDVMKEIRSARVWKPVSVGDIIIEKVAGLDVNIVATRKVGANA